MRSFLFTAVLGVALSFDAAAQTTPAHHSMQEMAFLIGHWRCAVTQAGQPNQQTTATYDWMYDGAVLRETLTGPGFAGQFLTTYDARSNTFKGVAAVSGGATIVWENGGMADNHSSEIGYVFGNGQMREVSRTTLERISDAHYIIRDFLPTTPAGPGAPTDTEDCTKIAS